MTTLSINHSAFFFLDIELDNDMFLDCYDPIQCMHSLGELKVYNFEAFSVNICFTSHMLHAPKNQS